MEEDHKSLFAPSGDIYLLNHSVGRPPVTTRDAWAGDFLDPWENAGEEVWPRWIGAIEGFRDALARLLGGVAADYCPQTNLSSALTKIISGLPQSAQRRTILYSEQDFPSMGFVLQQAARLGYRLRALPEGIDTLDASTWDENLSAEVCLVLITHVHSNTGRQVPVAEICAMARSRGIRSIVDIAQSVGVLPIDLAAWQADFVIGSCVKWLCGGPGAGFLWVDPERLPDCEPTDVGWFSHENPFEFDINDFRYAGDALRFWGGTPSVQPYVTARNSIDVLHGIGIETVRAHNLALTRRIIDAVDENALVSPAATHQRGGTVVLNFPDRQQEALCTRLRQARVSFDARPTGIRLSPHIYNDDDEITAVLELF
jgi:selenocysteine lyase/cysteine desulfurase